MEEPFNQLNLSIGVLFGNKDALLPKLIRGKVRVKI